MSPRHDAAGAAGFCFLAALACLLASAVGAGWGTLLSYWRWP